MTDGAPLTFTTPTFTLVVFLSSSGVADIFKEDSLQIFCSCLAHMNTQEPAAQSGAGWDEAQCMAALAQLEQLQAQVRTQRFALAPPTYLGRLTTYASRSPE